MRLNYIILEGVFNIIPSTWGNTITKSYYGVAEIRNILSFKPPILIPSKTNLVCRQNSLSPTSPNYIGKLKTTVLDDSFGRLHDYLRISLTERCNLRCTYCMPEQGVHLTNKPNLLTTEEVIYLAKLFVNQGVRKIRLTGGEPTIRKDIIEIISQLRNIMQLKTVAITTNGLMLTKLLVSMQRAGLSSINISLDTLKADKFEKLTHRKGLNRVIAGIDLAIQLGYKPKLNCVLMKQFNEDEICDFVEFTKNRNVDVRFIEYMPFAGNKWQTEKMITFKDTLKIIKKKWPNLITLENELNDTSKGYKVPNFMGKLGFITSMTENFCKTCNRLRLTADGNLKVCLFGNKEVSLRDAIRNGYSEDDLLKLVSTAIKRKKKQHAVSEHYPNLGRQHYSTNITAYLNINRLNFNILPGLSYKVWRKYSSVTRGLTHVDGSGQAKMVNVNSKYVTIRYASAEAIVVVGPIIAKLIRENSLSKGDVLSVSRISGILGAKKTSELILLCHNINLSSVDVTAELDFERNIVIIRSEVYCEGKTGVEMEALTAVAVAALNVYDMCKAVSHNIHIKDINLIKKSGGKQFFSSTNVVQ